MKKVIALVIAVAMIACIAVTASAATANSLTVATVDGKMGDTVAIDVCISEGTGIGALEFDVNFDKALLKIVKIESGAASSAAGAMVDSNIDLDVPHVAAIALNGYQAAGAVVTVTFEVIGDIAVDAVAEVAAEVTLAQNDAGDVDVATTAGGVKGVPTGEIIDDPSEPPVGPSKDDDKPVSTKTNPKTGDVSAVAVAAGLCAVMAAAFVITKKVND